MNANLEILHQLVHQCPTYEESVNKDEPLVTVALASGELILMQLGLSLAMAQFPCLVDPIYAMADRVEELFEAQWPDNGEE